jgi:hypothetical protein
MGIACIDCFGVLLQDRRGTVTLRALRPAMFADYALRGTKCLLEHARCYVLARVGTAILNKLMGTTGRARTLDESGTR